MAAKLQHRIFNALVILMKLNSPARPMSTRIKRAIRNAMRRLGMDLVRWRPRSSPEAALGRMLAEHRIDTVLDVGANEGQYASLLRDVGFRGRIISFEPLSTAHRRLQRSAARDQLWTIAPRMALGDHDGEVQINVASNGASSSVLRMLEAHEHAAPDVRPEGFEMAPLARLDRVGPDLLSDAKNVFLKVDVQGYESQVLGGATMLLRKIVGVQLELSLVPLYEGQALFSSLIECMGRHGFSVWGITPEFVDNSTGRLLQTDVVFFR